MNSEFQGIALVLGVGFIALFLMLIWLVQVIFKAKGWHELGTPGHPIQIRSRMASRLIGALFVLAGCGFMVQSWRDAHNSRLIWLKLAAGGPAFIGMGTWMVIEGPELP